MQPLSSEQALFLLQDTYLPALKNEQRITTKVIEAVPLDKGHYRPDPVSRTALELAWHIVAASCLLICAPWAPRCLRFTAKATTTLRPARPPKHRDMKTIARLGAILRPVYQRKRQLRPAPAIGA